VIARSWGFESLPGQYSMKKGRRGQNVRRPSSFPSAHVVVGFHYDVAERYSLPGVLHKRPRVSIAHRTKALPRCIREEHARGISDLAAG
jgi:hypothetical protein